MTSAQANLTAMAASTKMSDLRKRATATGMTDGEVEEALDFPTPKAELLNRIAGRERILARAKEEERATLVSRGWSLPRPEDASDWMGPTIGLAAGHDSAGAHGSRYKGRPPLVASAVRVPFSLTGMLAASELRACSVGSGGTGIPYEAALWVVLCFLSTMVASATSYEVWCFSLKIFGGPKHMPTSALLGPKESRRKFQVRFSRPFSLTLPSLSPLLFVTFMRLIFGEPIAYRTRLTLPSPSRTASGTKISAASPPCYPLRRCRRPTIRCASFFFFAASLLRHSSSLRDHCCAIVRLWSTLFRHPSSLLQHWWRSILLLCSAI